jgi:hypothetical protein
MNVKRIKKWAGHVVSMGKKRGAPSPLTGKHEARDHTKGVGVHGKLVLQCVFEKEDDGMGGWWGVNWIRLA